ncbi:unnamed protein product [Calicophoron daubneyi]|uniref:RWD domain-containing protein n=1 Tax=Calicophoron daubneyi TaxID=300641 RepID=A0AAV2TPA1_CALDB
MCALHDELLLLGEVYPDECISHADPSGGVTVVVRITPGVGFNVNANKLIQFTLTIHCDSQYPLKPPKTSIDNVHGLKDSDVGELNQILQQLGEERKGSPVLFEIIDFCREFIASNVPTVSCTICLAGFDREEEAYVTPAFHYFHKVCIGKYLLQRELDYRQETSDLLAKDPYADVPALRFPCPVCQVEEIPYSDELVRCAAEA